MAFEWLLRDTGRVAIKRYTCNTHIGELLLSRQQILHNMKQLSVRSQLNSHTAHTVRVFLNLLINGQKSMAFVSSTTVEEMPFFVITDRVICGWLSEGRRGVRWYMLWSVAQHAAYAATVTIGSLLVHENVRLTVW